MDTLSERLPILKEIAGGFLRQRLPYDFNELEEEALKPFFTNLHKRVCFMHSLPLTLGDVLMAMYSRIKNPKGIRGVFVDQFLPQLLANQLDEVEKEFNGDASKFLREKNIKSLQHFSHYSLAAQNELRRFICAFSPRYLHGLISGSIVPGRPMNEVILGAESVLRELEIGEDYLRRLTSSKRVKNFLTTWLDTYGHNSIARMAGGIWICFEKISLLAAKSLEWNRPGSGFIELSTRYVDMSGADRYPIENELAIYGSSLAGTVASTQKESFAIYRELQGEKWDGPFPKFLREKWGQLVPDTRDLENGVIGETCDVLGNFLPASTLTSVGVAVSGEAFPALMRHLILDGTPENLVLADMILTEAPALGYDQFLRHIDPTEWQKRTWEYLDWELMSLPKHFPGQPIIHADLPVGSAAGDILYRGFECQREFEGAMDFQDVVEKLASIPRGAYDKLPRDFESVVGRFTGAVSFRSWRDIQRQGFSTHNRTLLTPQLGFYAYDKPAPEELSLARKRTTISDLNLWRMMRDCGAPKIMRQYPLAIGHLVDFSFGANLRQLEFCNWQRSKFSVNHEVRQVFLGMERALRRKYHWWEKLSRADTTPAYLFARTKEGIPLPGKH